MSILKGKMTNKRFMEMADRMKNPSLPAERKTKPALDLTQILKRDSKGKPILNLNPIKETVVNTQTQKDYYTLMRAYECGGWKWVDGDLPTQQNNWGGYEKESCIGAGCSYYSEKNNGEFRHGSRNFYLEKGWEVISTQQFYNQQNITLGMLDEINEYFKRQNDK